MSKNAKRRHLTAGQLAVAAAKVQDWSQADQRGGDRRSQHAKTDQGEPVPFDTAAKRAASVGVSSRTQKDADLVVREAPELADQVTAGEVSLKSAAKQVRQRKGYSGRNGKGAPVAADHDSPPSLEASSEDEGPTPAETIEMLAPELDAYRIAAASNEESAKAIVNLQGQIRALESQRDEWMIKASEMVKPVEPQTRL